MWCHVSFTTRRRQSGVLRRWRIFLWRPCGDPNRCDRKTYQRLILRRGVVMGMGMALTEDTVIEGGLHKSRNFTTYILPTACEAPEIETIAVESVEETGPFGAKGIGEVVR
jgi:hypothetical protein